MKEQLSESKIHYLLEHLGHHVRISEDLFSRFRFGAAQEEGKALIYFPLSDLDLDLPEIIYFDHIPILYPIERERDIPYSISGKNLVFHHDILKSAFHLLSGYEEFQSEDADLYGRYPFTSSLQYALGIVERPIVN